jgi:hypothetical protein
MSSFQLEMGDLGEKAYEACLASRATVTNTRPEKNLPPRVKILCRTRVIRRLSAGSKFLTFSPTCRKTKHFSLWAPICAASASAARLHRRLSTFGLCRSHKVPIGYALLLFPQDKVFRSKKEVIPVVWRMQLVNRRLNRSLPLFCSTFWAHLGLCTSKGKVSFFYTICIVDARINAWMDPVRTAHK